MSGSSTRCKQDSQAPTELVGASERPPAKQGDSWSMGKNRRPDGKTAAGSTTSGSGDDAHLLRDSSSVSKVFWRLSSSMRVTVTSFSRSLDSAVAIGGVTPRNLTKPRFRIVLRHGSSGKTCTLCQWPFCYSMKKTSATEARSRCDIELFVQGELVP